MRYLPILLTIVVGLAGADRVPGAGAQDPWAVAEAMAQRAAERIRALQRESEALAAQERTLLVELRQLEVQQNLKAAELAKLDADLARTSAEIARTEDETARLEETLARQKPQIRARMIELYKLGQAGYWRLLLNVDDLRSIGRAYRDVSALAKLGQERIAEHRRTLAALAEAQQSLTAHRIEVRGLRSKAQAARAELDRAAAARQARISEIDRRRDLTAELTGELQVAERRLQAAVKELAGGGTATAMLPFKPFQGDMDWPVDGRVVVPFGPQTRSRFGTGVQRNGIEIDAVEGASVRAIHGGTVAYADGFTGYGYLVILDHGDQAYSLYGYLGSLSVERGVRVESHTVLGAVGRTPAGDAARLYFEIRVDGEPVDPVEWLKARR